MSTLLPNEVIRLIEGAPIVEFATVSTAGVPIDTPVYVFPAEDLSVLAVATGLSYPAKAERARKNPKVGVLIEGADDQPVVLMRGIAAVRDKDLQDNAIRYLSETGYEGLAFGLDWSVAREAVWYFTRLIVEITPHTILWWENPAAMHRTPQIWTAPADVTFPRSDPAPEGVPSKPSPWPERDWREIARDGMARNIAPHLTLMDEGGFPLPVRVTHWEFDGEQFLLRLPSSIPWSGQGKASLTFLGLETFIGRVTQDAEMYRFVVERALPQLPMMQDPRRVLQPDAALRETLLGRLRLEVARRHQPIPVLPQNPPQLTRLAKHRRTLAGGKQPMATTQK